MRGTFLIFILISVTAYAEDFTSKANDLASKASKETKPMIEDAIKQFKSKESLGGIEITEKEFEMLKRFGADMTEAVKPASSATVKAPTMEEHNKRINEFYNMPKTAFVDKAKLCQKLSAYYKQFASASSSIELGGGHAPVVRATAIARVNLPADFKDVPEKEMDVINNCLINRFYMSTTYTVANRVQTSTLNTGKYYCDECDPLENSALFVNFLQKLDEGVYQVNPSQINMGNRSRMSFGVDKAIVFKSDKNIESGQRYIFGVYAGTESMKLKNGFSKQVPVVLDIGIDGASAVYARFQQIRDYLYANFKGKVRCVHRTLADNGFDFVQAGCYPTGQKLATAREWPKDFASD